MYTNGDYTVIITRGHSGRLVEENQKVVKWRALTQRKDHFFHGVVGMTCFAKGCKQCIRLISLVLAVGNQMFQIHLDTTGWAATGY